jgi:acetoin utilization deacetylase AcuC-like enzyme
MKVYYPSRHLQHNPPYEGYTQAGTIPALEVPERAVQVLTALQQAGWAEIAPPVDLGIEPILDVHSQLYLDYLQTVYQQWEPRSPTRGTAFFPGTYGLDPQAVLAGDVPEQSGFFLMDTTVSGVAATYAAALQSAQTALSAAQDVSQGQDAVFALCRPPGHHAGREVCGGYCYLNNAAIAAQFLSRQGKVAILDVDYHCGNGTQEIFYRREDVFTISIHADPSFEYPRYAGYADEKGEGPGTGFHRNFPLETGTGDRQYLPVLKEALALVAAFSPQALVVSAGMDTYQDDPLGTFKLTRDGLYKVGAHIAALNLPTVVVMEGGYHLPSLGANMVAFLEAFQARQAV